MTKYTRTNELANKQSHRTTHTGFTCTGGGRVGGAEGQGLYIVIYLPKFDIIMSSRWVGRYVGRPSEPYRTRCVITTTPKGKGTLGHIRKVQQGKCTDNFAKAQFPWVVFVIHIKSVNC